MADQSPKLTSDRKKDHIELAFEADMSKHGNDTRFFYEPLLAAHPSPDEDISIDFLGKKLKAPIWVSSMTGGTAQAYDINRRLAEACAKFGLGMALGSCRPLLHDSQRLSDFDVRDLIGNDLPLYANLGIAQVEKLLEEKRSGDITGLVTLLRADGLVVHINPLQEWLQPEGDRFNTPPIETLTALLEAVDFPVIVKEVGQGMGKESISAVLKMPFEAFELAAHGGTNFSRLELLRSTPEQRHQYDAISHLGHSISEMVYWINQMSTDNNDGIKCRQIIVSGGVKNFLDGYYWTQHVRLPAIYGQASTLLKYARESQEALDEFIQQQIKGLQLARAFLTVR